MSQYVKKKFKRKFAGFSVKNNTNTTTLGSNLEGNTAFNAQPTGFKTVYQMVAAAAAAAKQQAKIALYGESS